MTLHRSLRGGTAAALILVGTATPLRGQAALPVTPRSAPLTNLRYEVAYDSAAAQKRSIAVTMSFDVAGPGPVLLSFPDWTPGSYELGFFARWVSNFSASAGEKPLVWDKLDYDTWRVQPAGARSMTVKFAFLADTLDNAIAW